MAKTVVRPLHYNDDKKGEAEARAMYDTLKLKHKEIYLLHSSHWATEGYWIEFKKPQDLVGIILKHQTVTDAQGERS